MNRRDFLRLASASAASAAFGNLSFAAKKTGLPSPDSSGIEHVIVLMMENRSLDHIMGWLPGVNGVQAGLTYYDANGAAFSTHALAPDYQGCSHPDPDHSWEGGRVCFDDGLCDGWLRAGQNDDYAIGYYTAQDLPFLSGAAPAWTACSRYFAAIMASTWPNRIYQHAGVTDRLDNSQYPSTLPTIWDRLLAKGISARYYFSDFPFLGIWGPKYLPIMRTVDDFIADAAAGTLPAVYYVDPSFNGEDSGTSNDDHPHADIRAGETFMNRIYEAVVASPNFASTVFVINFDEWGGFFDHVAPDTAPDVDPRYQLRGFRVPCLLISPFARRGAIAHEIYDHTSILKMIEWRWGLDPLSRRDARANNLANALDFTRFDLSAPHFSVPDVVSVACP
jgi:phospholipase C